MNYDAMRNMGKTTIHRVGRGEPFTACGLPLKGARYSYGAVDCKRCLATKEHKERK